MIFNFQIVFTLYCEVLKQKPSLTFRHLLYFKEIHFSFRKLVIVSQIRNIISKASS